MNLENRERVANELNFTYGKGSIKIKREDPHGFWKIYPDNVTLPEPMTNNWFTSVDLAESALVNYVIQQSLKAEKKRA